MHSKTSLYNPTRNILYTNSL